jgi:hypothetical protein
MEHLNYSQRLYLSQSIGVRLAWFLIKLATDLKPSKSLAIHFIYPDKALSDFWPLAMDRVPQRHNWKRLVRCRFRPLALCHNSLSFAQDLLIY